MDFDMADKKEQMGMNNRPPGTDTSIIRNNKINIDIALIPPSIAEYNRSAFTSTEVLIRSAVNPPLSCARPEIPDLNELEKTPYVPMPIIISSPDMLELITENRNT
tara:strand:+ start:510 stop:827 length:318 start_codon:yes stop_codon:yes gene_type:complete